MIDPEVIAANPYNPAFDNDPFALQVRSYRSAMVAPNPTQALTQFFIKLNGPKQQFDSKNFLESWLQQVNVITQSISLATNLINTVIGAPSNYDNIDTSSLNTLGNIESALSSNFSNSGGNATFSQMPAPYLRYWKEQGDTHPVVSSVLAKLGLDYFSNMSDSIGTIFNVSADSSSLGPTAFLNNRTTNTSPVRKSVSNKLIPGVHDMMINSQTTLYQQGYTNYPQQNFSSVLGSITGKAHGFNLAPDISQINQSQLNRLSVFTSLISIFGDKLRLLNNFLPVTTTQTTQTESYVVPIEGFATVVHTDGSKYIMHGKDNSILNV